MGFANRLLPSGRKTATEGSLVDGIADQDFVDGGEFKYVVEHAGNGSGPSYQEVSGAPVETTSPLGYNVGPITLLFLNISMMIGTGIYSTPAYILIGVGSVGLSFFYWTIGFLLSGSSIAVYLEFASFFPNRSGSEVVYLEQAYPRPKWLFPTTFALWYMLLSFSSANCIVMASYLFAISSHVPTAWELKGVAVAVWTLAILSLIFSTRWAYRVSNIIGGVKVLTLVFVAITGLVVLGGHTKVKDPKANFRKPFAHTSSEPYGLTTSLTYIYFSYGGYNNAFNVVNEVKNPIRSIKIFSTISLLVVLALYLLANAAYIAAVPLEELKAAKQIAAALFFEKVFGLGGGFKFFNFLIALSAFGNIIASNIGVSRITRECGRQGVLPYPRFWASTKPFGTPLGPYIVKYLLTVLLILAPPAGDAFNFLTSLQVYPNASFNVLVAVGLYVVRWRRKKSNLPQAPFKAWDVAVVFNILVNLYMIVMPWYPPPAGGSNVSFWYGTASVTGIAIVILCVAYYYIWIHLLPHWRGYRIRQETLQLGDGAITHSLIKVPVTDIERWDETHDALGRQLDSGVGSSTGFESDEKRPAVGVA